MRTTYRAKLFKSGGSQAVRLPKECRLPGDEVLVHRDGDRVVLEPIERRWSPEFIELFRGPPDETMPARAPQGKQKAREPLD